MPKVEDERSKAARVAGCAELNDIRLFKVESRLSAPSFQGEMMYSLSSDISFQTVGEPVEHVIVNGEYVVKVADAAGYGDGVEVAEGDPEPPEVASIAFTLAALYSVPPETGPEDSFADDEYEAFAGTTGQFALYPYARELIADITGRMGLPSLHVSPLRFQLDKPDE